MNVPERLNTLKQRHQSLEGRIADETRRPRPDDDTLTRLKSEKLKLKEEIERLRPIESGQGMSASQASG